MLFQYAEDLRCRQVRSHFERWVAAYITSSSSRNMQTILHSCRQRLCNTIWNAASSTFQCCSRTA